VVASARWLTALVLMAVALSARAEPALLERDAIRQLAEEHGREAVTLFREFLALPNNARYPAQIDVLNAWMIDAFEGRGFEAKLLPTAGSPVLYAKRAVPGAEATVLVYLQADGQPVDPSAWSQADPYVAVLKEQGPDEQWHTISWDALATGFDADWRIFARSAADSKGPMTQFLSAVELLDKAGQPVPFNLKVLVDTEEELGSPHLRDAVIAHRDLLAADMLLIFDGPPHASNRPTVSLGARGIATVTLTTYGPLVAQHSGHYGNFMPNPAFDLAHILASLKTPAGVVAVDGFYDGIEIDEQTRALLAAVPDDEESILASAGLARRDAVAPTLQESLQYPSLNVRGLSAAWTGDEARTIIPPTAVAEIDIRLVKESDPERLIGLLRKHIEALGFKVIDHEPATDERRVAERLVRMDSNVSYGAFRSDPDSAPARLARRGLAFLFGEPPIVIRTMGGSIPIAPMIGALGTPAAIVPTVNIDNNQHSPNENLRLGNFVGGIAMLMSVLQQPIR